MLAMEGVEEEVITMTERKGGRNGTFIIDVRFTNDSKSSHTQTIPLSLLCPLRLHTPPTTSPGLLPESTDPSDTHHSAHSQSQIQDDSNPFDPSPFIVGHLDVDHENTLAPHAGNGQDDETESHIPFAAFGILILLCLYTKLAILGVA